MSDFHGPVIPCKKADKVRVLVPLKGGKVRLQRRRVREIVTVDGRLVSLGLGGIGRTGAKCTAAVYWVSPNDPAIVAHKPSWR